MGHQEWEFVFINGRAYNAGGGQSPNYFHSFTLGTFFEHSSQHLIFTCISQPVLLPIGIYVYKNCQRLV
jgi:hypothetical protein